MRSSNFLFIFIALPGKGQDILVKFVAAFPSSRLIVYIVGNSFITKLNFITEIKPGNTGI
jgi:hypothetical protein